MRDGTNWSDDRLDELEQDVKTQAQAITYSSLQLATVKAEVQHLRDRITERSTSRVNWWIIAATFSNSLTALIVYLISKGSHG